MTKQVICGGLPIGGGAPVSIQSMLNIDVRRFECARAQLDALVDAGADIVRIAVPDADSAAAFGEMKKVSKVPLVADIHFDYRLAIAAIEQGADKVRINPGNIGSKDRIAAVVKAAKERGIPIRVGDKFGLARKGAYRKIWWCDGRRSLRKCAEKCKNTRKYGFRRYSNIAEIV